MTRLLNRKSALAVMLLGMLEAFRGARGQSVPRPMPAGEDIDIAALKREFGSLQVLKTQMGTLNQLSKEIEALAARVAAVEAKQAQTIGFTKTTDGYAFAPAGGGNVTIQAPNGLALKGITVAVSGTNVDVTGTRISHRAPIIALN